MKKLTHGQKVQRGMARARRGILSPASKQRRERLAKGLCGACGKRKRWNDHGKVRPECRRCTGYYRGLAKAARERSKQ